MALVVVVLALVFALLPYKFANAVPCGPPLLGPKATADRGKVGFTLPQRACRQSGASRLTVTAVAAVVAVAAAVAPALLPAPGEDCRQGRHDDCRAWWASSLGGLGALFSCQCRCHQAERQGKFRN